MAKVTFGTSVYIDCTHDWYYDEQEVVNITFEGSSAIVSFMDDYKQNEFDSKIADKLLRCAEIRDTEGNKASELNITATEDKPYITIDFTED